MIHHKSPFDDYRYKFDVYFDFFHTLLLKLKVGSNNQNMKLILPFIGAVYASKQSHHIAWNRIQALWENTAAKTQNQDARKIMELFTISAIANYGCWCRFNNVKPHRGPTMDDVDEDCKTWYLNYQCMSHDFGGTCNEAVDYNDTMTEIQDPFLETIDYVTECESRNPGDTCASTACAVDANFIRGVVNYLADNSLNQTLNGFFPFSFDGSACGVRDHTGTTAQPEIFTTADFTTDAADATTTAAGTTAVPVPNSACCGEYPQRFPYKTKGGIRGCCENAAGSGVTFDTNFLECCADGSTSVIGACP